MNSGFQLYAPLGSGGYGDVFLAIQRDNGACVVIKILRDHHLPHARKAFEREIRLLSRPRRGQVPLLFANMAARPPYYVMPYFDGGSLTQYAGNLTDLQLQAIAAHVADTLATLHAAFEAHGDVKPDNILLTRQGQLGVADPLGKPGLLTTVFSNNRGGTAGYCAPEVWRGAAISPAADAFSFAATMCHLATGQRPEQGQLPDIPTYLLKTVPKLREAIETCSHPDPNQRPSMRDVIRILRGESWATIRVQRRQSQQISAALCALGVCVLFAIAQ